MKVILNKDLNPLGEEGDVKEVAKGYARNFLFPRGIALPYTESTVKLFESRRAEIEARKADKRKDASGLKEKLEALEPVITMPAGANGRLYGAVTNQTVADELAKAGFQIERKRIELPGNSFKSVGKYKVTVKLYESAQAELTITVQGQAIKAETPSAPPRKRRLPEARPEAPQAETSREETPQTETSQAEAPQGETPQTEAQPEAPEKAGESVPEAPGTETAAPTETVPEAAQTAG